MGLSSPANTGEGAIGSFGNIISSFDPSAIEKTLTKKYMCGLTELKHSLNLR